MQAYDAQWLSLLPPIIAIGLALMTKEVFSSLLAGIFTGTIIYTLGTGGSFLTGTLDTTFAIMTKKLDFDILLFCSLLGALVYVISLSGGTVAYGKAASKLIQGRRSALVATSGLGASIFIDDYFNCLTVGTVMRPLTDRYGVSRAKLAYIIDSTAAPICIIAPVSSWAAAVGSSLKDTGAFDSDLGAFIAAVPWNFYALLSLVMVGIMCLTDSDFGPMHRAERLARNKGAMEDATSPDDVNPSTKLKFNPNGRVFDMLLPLVCLIFFAILAMLQNGGYWGTDAKYQTFMNAIGNCSASKALVWASFGALVIAFILYVPRKLMTFSEFFEGSVAGMKLMLPANIILILAWTLSGVCRELLSTPVFVEHLVLGTGIGATFLPLIVFAVAAFLSFSMGTAWGTFGILIPIVVPIVAALDPSLTVVVLSSTLAGSVFGDHCSPISDTTILSSAGSGCRHIDHVSTQIPYSAVVAVSSAAGYLVAGLTRGSLMMSYLTALVVLGVLIVFLHRRSVARDGGVSA